jgi:hypothetical protein
MLLPQEENMRLTTLITIWVVRVAGIIQLVLGTLFWTGRAYQYLGLHISGGFLVVLGLWTLALLALSNRAGRGLAIFALLWGLALPAFGMQQARILVGSLHWIIRVIHLIMGMAAIGTAERLAKAILAALASRRAGVTGGDVRGAPTRAVS